MLRTVGKWLLATAFVVALSVPCFKSLRVETSLLSLLGNAADQQELLSVFNDFSDTLNVLFKGPTPKEVVANAKSALAQVGDTHLVNGMSAQSVQSFISLISEHRSGLLNTTDRTALLAGNTQDLRDQALRTWQTEMSPSLLPFLKDPFFFTQHFILARPSMGFEPYEGILVKHLTDGTCVAWLNFDLKGLSEPARERFIAQLKPLTPFISGVPIHTSETTQACQKELTYLSIFITLFIIVLMYWQFRSLRVIGVALLTLSFSSLIAIGALFICFPAPHMLVFIFGTTLIGLSTDFILHLCINAQNQQSIASTQRQLLRPMTIACCTTVASFVPLLFSTILFLREAAVFTIIGLLATFLFVQCYFGDWVMGKRHPFPSLPIFKINTRRKITMRPRILFLLALLLTGLTLYFLPPLHLTQSPQAFYQASPQLLTAEKTFYTDVGQNVSTWWITTGDTIETLLQNEEAANIQGLSALIPSQKRQAENATLLRAFYEKEAVPFQTAFGLEQPPTFQSTPFLTPEIATANPLLHLAINSLLSRTSTGWLSRAPEDGHAHPGAHPFKPQQVLEAIFKQCTSATATLLLPSFLGVMLLIFAFLRKRALRVLLPLYLTALTLWMIASLTQLPITIFHLLSLFILLGLGIDYAVFYQSESTRFTARAVCLSFLTSAASFGGLALTTFPVTQAIGITIGLGLFLVWSYTLLLSKFLTHPQAQQ